MGDRAAPRGRRGGGVPRRVTPPRSADRGGVHRAGADRRARRAHLPPHPRHQRVREQRDLLGPAGHVADGQQRAGARARVRRLLGHPRRPVERRVHGRRALPLARRPAPCAGVDARRRRVPPLLLAHRSAHLRCPGARGQPQPLPVLARLGGGRGCRVDARLAPLATARCCDRDAHVRGAAHRRPRPPPRPGHDVGEVRHVDHQPARHERAAGQRRPLLHAAHAHVAHRPPRRGRRGGGADARRRGRPLRGGRCHPCRPGTAAPLADRHAGSAGAGPGTHRDVGACARRRPRRAGLPAPARGTARAQRAGARRRRRRRHRCGPGARATRRLPGRPVRCEQPGRAHARRVRHGRLQPSPLHPLHGQLPRRPLLPRRGQPVAGVPQHRPRRLRGRTAAHAEHHARARWLGGTGERAVAQHVQRAVIGAAQRHARRGVRVTGRRGGGRGRGARRHRAHRALCVPRVHRRRHRGAGTAARFRRRPPPRGGRPSATHRDRRACRRRGRDHRRDFPG